MPEKSGRTHHDTEPSKESSDGRDEGKEATGLGFSLPPISLPPVRLPALRFPEGFSPTPPLVERVRGSRNMVLAAIAVDCIDAIAIVKGMHGILPVLVGSGIGYLILGPIGLGYSWEILPILLDVPQVAAVPTLTVLVVINRVLLSN